MSARHDSRAMVPLVAATLAAAATLTIGAAPQTPPSADPLPALLTEVRALRIAIEQQAAIGPRVQLTLARLNIEEQRATHLAADLNLVRQQLSGSELALQRASDSLSDVERQQQSEAEPAKRRELEGIRRDLAYQIRDHTSQVQQLRTRENDAAQALANEQARWADLNARLDELERLLAPVR